MVIIHSLSSFWYIDLDDLIKRYDTEQISIAKTQARILFSGPDWRIEPLEKVLEQVVSNKPGDNRLYDRWQKKRKGLRKEIKMDAENATINSDNIDAVKILRLSVNLLYRELEHHIGHLARITIRPLGEIELFCETCERDGRTNLSGDYSIIEFDYKDIE